MQIDPLQLNARINLDSALMNAVPTWHFAMMNDAPRNAAYDEAIRRVVPGRSVLDIGTGAGLLAMMAARAGAKSVTSCEQTPWIAAKAREVVAANGLADRIKLIAKHSSELKIGTDLSERAEVLVTEVFGTSAINELVIPTVAHAHAQLLRPGATVVPRAASVRAYLAGGPALEGYFFVDRAAGFTIAPFNDLARLRMDLQAARCAVRRFRGLSPGPHAASAATRETGDRSCRDPAGPLLRACAVAAPRSHRRRHLRESSRPERHDRRLEPYPLPLCGVDRAQGRRPRPAVRAAQSQNFVDLELARFRLTPACGTPVVSS
jgi:predicted nicotinamide N-methyase